MGFSLQESLIAQELKGIASPQNKEKWRFPFGTTLDRPSAIFLDFFTPASSPESAEVHARRSRCALKPQKPNLGDLKICEEIRIYVADLAAYNNGKLHGVWIDATLDMNDIQEAVSKMFKSSPEGFAEEYAIHDFEGYGSYRLGEYEGLESAREIACFIEEHGEVAPEL